MHSPLFVLRDTHFARCGGFTSRYCAHTGDQKGRLSAFSTGPAKADKSKKVRACERALHYIELQVGSPFYKETVNGTYGLLPKFNGDFGFHSY